MHWGLVWVDHTGHPLHLAPLRGRVEAFDISLLDDLEGCVNEHLDERADAASGVDHSARLVAGVAVRAHQRADHEAAVTNNLRGDEADSPHVLVAVLSRETQAP